MRTDTIFYQLFLTSHSLLFELIGQPLENAESYQFLSVEVKEKAFRFDGIFMPDGIDKLIYFTEVQFQNNPGFYWEFIAEINLYLNQYRPVQNWKAVAIFAKRIYEPEILNPYHQELIANQRILRVYLEDLPQGSISMAIIELIISKETQTPRLVESLRQRVSSEITEPNLRRSIIELLKIVLVAKFPQLSRQEIEAMFLLSDIKQTKVYQEARQEGRQEGVEEGEREKAKSLVLRLLTRRLGQLDNSLSQAVQKLEISQLDVLAEALLDFTAMDDLRNWLARHTNKRDRLK